MDPVDSPRGPWNPDRAWADPLIVLLLLIAAVLSAIVLQRRSAPAPSIRVGIQGRMLELPYAAEGVFAKAASTLVRAGDLARAAYSLSEPWDRALAGVLAAERGDPALGRNLIGEQEPPGPAGAAFRRCWLRAYGGGPAERPQDRPLVRNALGNGWAAGLLEARLERGESGPAIPRTTDRMKFRLLVLAFLGLGVVAAGLAGIAVAIALLVSWRKGPPPVVRGPACSGRALILVVLGWYLGLVLSGTLTAPLFLWIPALRPLALPINVSLHAAWGVLLLKRAQGDAWTVFWRGLWPGGWGRQVGWGLAHLALAVPLVLAASWLARPLTRRFPPPQREMLEFLSGLDGVWALLLTALTVAVIAPLFEELLFRGAVLPALARRWGWTPAILASGLLFGVIHLQPAGLPTLGALGVILGAAFRRGGGLLPAILVHSIWNGGVFVFLRTLTS